LFRIQEPTINRKLLPTIFRSKRATRNLKAQAIYSGYLMVPQRLKFQKYLKMFN